MFCMVENQEKRTKTGKLTIKKNNKELDKLIGRMTRPETIYTCNVYRGFFHNSCQLFSLRSKSFFDQFQCIRILFKTW